MAVSHEFKSYITELMAPLGRVSIREMFGGAGIFYDGAMFALIADETLYLKVDETTKDAFEDEGSAPFMYDTRDGKRSVMSYYEMPEHLLDEPDEFIIWMRRAVGVALRAKRRTPSPRPGRPRGPARPRARKR